jgi:Glycosyl transferase family 11
MSESQTPRRTGLVKVKYQGRLGNRLGQFCLGRIIATELGFSLRADPVDGFPHTGPVGETSGERLPRTDRFSAHRIDLAGVLADRQARKIVLEGYFQRYDYYRPHKEAIRGQWLRAEPRPPASPDELTIHVRNGGDVWQDVQDGQTVVHCDYPALPFSFYRSIVGERRWGAVSVVTQDPDDPLVQKLVASFGARVHSGEAVEDFNRLRAARNLVLSVSTFAWWAAWLSDAERIYYPIAGLFDPERVRLRSWEWQPDMWVSDESRYLRRGVTAIGGDWRGTPEDRRRLLET